MQEAKEAVKARRLVHLAEKSNVPPVLTNECPLSDSRCRKYKVRSWPAMSMWKVDWCKGQPSMMGTKYVIPSPDSIVIPGQENTLVSSSGPGHCLSIVKSAWRHGRGADNWMGKQGIWGENFLSLQESVLGWCRSGSDQWLNVLERKSAGFLIKSDIQVLVFS